jgi:threonine dehydratase
MNLTVPDRPFAVRPTTWIEPERLRAALGLRITLATETFQRTGSFKFRAAFHRARTSPAPHLLAASSGNFGQALALACKLLRKRATIVMPSISARVKIDAVRSHGARVELTDVEKESREDAVSRLLADLPEAEVASAYDDPAVIAGNATLGVEIATRLRRWSAGRRQDAVVVVPIGGGGISSGILTGLQSAGMDDVPVIGAEPLLANDAAVSLRRGELVSHAGEALSLADGARLPRLGANNWEILRKGIRGIVEVPEPQIAEGVRALFQAANLKAEPTGSLGIGALLTDPGQFRDKEVLVVITGGNVDPAVYSRILAGANSVAEAYG